MPPIRLVPAVYLFLRSIGPRVCVSLSLIDGTPGKKVRATDDGGIWNLREGEKSREMARTEIYSDKLIG